MTVAFTREVSRSLERCELTHLPRRPMDLERARAQHEALEECLRGLGCGVRRLEEEPELPDAVFLEDTAVVLDELAVIARPGVASRRPETASVAAALAPLRPLVRIEAPGTLDGGDVLAVGRRVFVGTSGRTNRAGAEQLRAALAPHGYRLEELPVEGCLHLKSAATRVGPETVLLQPLWAERQAFAGLDIVEIDPGEPFAANALRIRGTIVHPAAFPRTRARLEARGFDLRAVDTSELAKAEGGVTCCALVLEVEA